MTYRQWLEANNLPATQETVERWISTLEDDGYDPGDPSWDFIAEDLGYPSGTDIRDKAGEIAGAAGAAVAAALGEFLGEVKWYVVGALAVFAFIVLLPAIARR